MKKTTTKSEDGKNITKTLLYLFRNRILCHFVNETHYTKQYYRESPLRIGRWFFHSQSFPFHPYCEQSGGSKLKLKQARKAARTEQNDVE